MRKSSAGLLLLLIIALMAVMGARFAQKDEPVGAAESETVTQAPAQQVESKLENADAARDTEPQTVKEPEGSQVNEPDWKREAEYIAKAVYGEAGNCGIRKIFNNKGNRMSAFELWKLGRLVGK
jgi:outer membrane lipoprotein-sorting protein